MERVGKLSAFLNHYFRKDDGENYGEGRIQTFNCPCSAPDFQYSIYNEDDIIVNYAPGYGYIDVLGLSEDEFQHLLNISEVCYN